MLEETDPFIYNVNYLPPVAAGNGHDVPSLLDRSAVTWLSKANKVYHDFAKLKKTVMGSVVVKSPIHSLICRLVVQTHVPSTQNAGGSSRHVQVFHRI